MNKSFFLAGVPATGKTWVGRWLAENHGYVHIDAEKNIGADFDKVGMHEEWNKLIATGRASAFVASLRGKGKPVVINWGFPTRFLYVGAALQSAGIGAWWLHGCRAHARAAFLNRGSISPVCFDRQMDDIEREWSLYSLVFGPRIILGLNPDSSQRKPEDIWSDIKTADQSPNG
jgi:hypothetical protein